MNKINVFHAGYIIRSEIHRLQLSIGSLKMWQERQPTRPRELKIEIAERNLRDCEAALEILSPFL